MTSERDTGADSAETAERGEAEPARKIGIDPEPVFAPDASDEPVPRLPRGAGFKLSGANIIRILMVAALLIAVIAMRKPCADGVASFMGTFEASPDAGTQPQPRPGTLITGDMSEQEQIRRIEEARRRAGETADAGPPPSADLAPDAGVAIPEPVLPSTPDP